MKELINPYCIKHKCKNIQDKECEEKYNTWKIVICRNINKKITGKKNVKN